MGVTFYQLCHIPLVGSSSTQTRERDSKKIINTRNQGSWEIT
jgi:hypothetical protein